MSTRRPNAGAGANLTRPSAPGPGSSSNNTRTPTAATRPTAEMSRTMATALGRNPSTSASTSATRMGRPRAASMSTPTAAAEPMWKPLFGLEIEIFVKLRPELEHALRTQLSQGPQPSESYWRHWDLDLSNGRGSPEKKEMQRKCVGMAIMAQIELVLGPTHGWKCEPDASLKEYELKKPEAYGPPDRGKWCMSILPTFGCCLAEYASRTNQYNRHRGDRDHLSAHVGGAGVAARDPSRFRGRGPAV